jgi:hypothetical protein
MMFGTDEPSRGCFLDAAEACSAPKAQKTTTNPTAKAFEGDNLMLST